MKKRIISLIVAVILCVAMIVPASVNADVDANLPYFEKLVTVEGDTVTLAITLRGPNKACCGGQVDIGYPAEKLTYQCPGVNPNNTEMWDDELPWLGISNGNINGHTDPGKFIVNFFGANPFKTDQILCEVTFKITEGQTVNASDFTILADLVSDDVGKQVDNSDPIKFECKHTEYKADPDSTVAPTCNTAGKTVEKCVSCGDAKETETPATGVHNFVLDETKSIPATETTDGINYFDCADCDETKTEKVEKTGVVDAKPYHEKVFKVTGDKVYLTVTLRGPDEVYSGEVFIDYNADKLEYVATPINQDWAMFPTGLINSNNPGVLKLNYYIVAANPYKSGTVVVVLEFNVKDGAKIEESDIVPTHDVTMDTNGFYSNMPSAPVYIFCEHTNYVENTEESVAPTCENAGTKVYYCDNCGDKKVEEVPALGHDYKTTTVDATCEVAGSTTTTCSRCDYNSVVDIPALGHDYKTETVDATCTADGSTTTTCSRCDYKNVEVIPAKGHSFSDPVVTKEATCTEAGVKTGTCTACGETTEEAIPALGHKYSEEVTAPTCEAAGYTTYTCSACGDTYTGNETAALGHKFSDPVVTKEPTCTEAGVETGTCTVCGETTEQAIPALGHDLSTETVDATCGADGSKTTTCSRCDYEEVEVIPATGEHDYNVDESTVVEATCTEAGKYTEVCATCGDEKETVVPALGHKLSDPVVTKEPTCTEAGAMTGTCTACDETVTEEIPATGHEYDEGKITKEPTETEEGEKTFKCENCGEEKVEKIAKLDPKPEDKPEDEPEADDTTKAPAGDATGDSAQLLLVSFIALISLAVLATIVFGNKARN